MNHLKIYIAQNKKDFEEAFALGCEKNAPYSSLKKQHALPSTHVIVAKDKNSIVGAIYLYGDNPFQLPIEKELNISHIKENLRLAQLELTSCSMAENIFEGLLEFALSFGTIFCNYDSFLFQSNNPEYEKYLKKIKATSTNLSDDSIFIINSTQITSTLEKNKDFDFIFPEKKFFHVSHQSMTPDLLKYFFTEKTNIFNELNDQEFRIIKNIYGFNENAKALPERNDKYQSEKAPRHRRYSVNCHGQLRSASGEAFPIVLVDVSREGIKIKGESTLEPNEVCTLTVNIGVFKQTELIAHVVWTNEENNTAGLVVKNGDQNWNSLIEYLETNLLSVA